MAVYDVIVLGAGAMGSAAAYYLSQAGQQVLLLEQFDLNHQRGSSNDHTRIIRYSYSKPEYIRLMQSAYPMWFALEEASGETLYTKTGGIDFGRPDEPRFRDTLNSLQTMHIPHEVLSVSEAHQRFPLFRFDEDMQVVFQEDYGVLAAEKCNQTHRRLAEQLGATILANTPVTGLKALSDGVEINTANTTYSAARVVITAGAWMNDLLSQVGITLPLIPLRVQLAYFEPENILDYTAGNFPIFISHLPEHTLYGIPSYQGSGLKVAFHGGEPVQHVSEIDYTPDDDRIEAIRRFSHRYLPGADAPLKFTRICLYTMTPDEDFIVDLHPDFPQIVFASPCSGHGFKFSTLIGSILTDLALNGRTEHDISLFRMQRFAAV